MEDTSQDKQEVPFGAMPAPVSRRPEEPRVRMVLLVQLGLSLLFSLAGALVFKAIAQLAGWDDAVLNGILAPDAAPGERWQMRLLLVISHLGTFVLAGWVTAGIFYPSFARTLAYLQAGVAPRAREVFNGILLMLLAIPLVLFLYGVNKAIPLPDSFHLLEEQTNNAIKGLLQMDNSLELLANLSLIALLPALGEELVFRGVVQQQLMRRIRQPWLALTLAAALFSFVHFQFEGFLPRMLLGVLLGWLYWHTRNFWVPVAAHFANNAAQVLGQYLYSRDMSTVDLEQDVDVPWYAALLSLVLVAAMIRWIKRSDDAGSVP